jgi:multidrug transporter EmrE-like cation transporter
MELRHYGYLLIAALLEAGGDTAIRAGLADRKPLILLGIALLGAYGIFFNQAPLPLATTFGLYIVFFAVVGAAIGSIRDGRVNPWTLLGVAIIVAGGLVIRYGATARPGS